MERYIEWLGGLALAAVISRGAWEYLKARRSSEKTVDDNLRALRQEVNALWDDNQFLRWSLAKLKLWITEHMMNHHGEDIDPDSILEDGNNDG